MEFPVKQIIEGHANEVLGKNKDISEERLKICKECPIYSKEWGGTCNRKLWLDPETGEVAVISKPGYVQGCGCRLLAKTTIPMAKCVAGKW